MKQIYQIEVFRALNDHHVEDMHYTDIDRAYLAASQLLEQELALAESNFPDYVVYSRITGDLYQVLVNARGIYTFVACSITIDPVPLNEGTA